ncbi:MAG: glycosyltransferase family 2 protein [Solirubrobacteraceae bacterium]|nr:glycosyltransferase family 2 protein [Solirubrobacteraceae bacterium]
MSTPKQLGGLTVAIPAQNASATIGTTIRSLAGQVGPDLQVLVIDDRSSDDTATVARANAGGLDLTVLPSGAPGAAGARNTALRAAAHDWVAFLDADDRWLPGAAAAFAHEIAAAPDAVACFGAARHVQADGTLIAVFRVDAAFATTEGLVLRRLQPTTSATAVRAAAALELGGFDEGFALPAGLEDSDLWWRLSQRGRCIVQPQPLCEYVVDDARLQTRSTAWLQDQRRDRERCIARLQAALPARLARAGAAQHYAVLARYWLAAGQPRQARADAIRALRLRPTAAGAAALGLSLVPPRGIGALRSARRSVLRRRPGGSA